MELRPTVFVGEPRLRGGEHLFCDPFHNYGFVTAANLYADGSTKVDKPLEVHDILGA
jgi:hypothetical protein